MKYKAIIFDMDGTIIDSEHIWNQASRQLITSRGITITPELDEHLTQTLTGMALPQSCLIIKNLAQLSECVEDLIAEKSQIACNLYSQHISFIDGFLAFHAKVLQANLKVGLATNADDATLSLTKKILKLDQLFGPHLYNISAVNNKGKPDPAIYLHTAKQLDVEPGACIAIEDSLHGIRAAVQAGMYCIGINTSKRLHGTKEAHTVIDSYEEIDLLTLLEQ